MSYFFGNGLALTKPTIGAEKLVSSKAAKPKGGRKRRAHVAPGNAREHFLICAWKVDLPKFAGDLLKNRLHSGIVY